MRALSFHAAAVLYTGGTIAQVAKLLLGFSWTDMPFSIDWLIVVLGAVAATGLIGFHRSIAYRGLWEHVTHWVIVVHLLASVALHLWTLREGDHELYAVFPYEYSYFAVAYFGFFAWRSWTVRPLSAEAPDS